MTTRVIARKGVSLSPPDGDSLLVSTVKSSKQVFTDIQNKFRSMQAEFLRIYNNTNTGNVISNEEFVQITKTLCINLEKSEIDFVSNNFASGIDGNLNWTKFVRRLDILPPDDYNEPEKFLDPLPHPLAGIVEILELDIFDTAWLEIIRLHPEIPIDSNGNSIIVRRNRNLEVLVTPSGLEKQTKIPTAITSIADCIFIANTDGSVSLSNSQSSSELHSLDVFQIQSDAPFTVLKLSNAVVINNSFEPPSKRVIAYAIFEAYQPTKVPESDTSATAKAKPPSKGGKPVVAVEEKESPIINSRSFTIKFKVLEVFGSEATRGVGAITCVSEEISCSVTSMTVAVSLSQDGGVACLTFENKSIVYSLTSLQQQVSAAVSCTGVSSNNSALPNIPEDSHVENVEKNSCLIRCKLVSIINLKDLLQDVAPNSALTSKLEYNYIEHCYPIFIGKIKSTKKLSSTAPGSLDASSLFYAKDYIFVVIPKHKPFWLLAGFTFNLPEVDSSNTSTKGAVLPTETTKSEEQLKLWTALRLSLFKLSGIVSATVIDDERSILGIGTIDGTVTVWDLLSKSLINICGKHAKAVSSLCLSEGITSHLLCSGAVDGTVCFYSIGRHNDVVRRVSDGTGASKLIEMRNDVPASAAISFCALKGISIVLCHFQDGTCVFYDAETACLLGKLVMYVGMQAQLTTSSPISMFEMLQRYRIQRDDILSVSKLQIIENGAQSSDSQKETTTELPGGTIPLLTCSTPEQQINEFFGSSSCQIFSCSDHLGFCVLFNETSKKKGDTAQADIVRCVFLVDKVIEIVCPGIASIRRTVKSKGSQVFVPSASTIFRTLTVGSRHNPSISIDSITISPDINASPNSVNGNKPKRATIVETSTLTEEHLRLHDNFDISFRNPHANLESIASINSKPILRSMNLGSDIIKSSKDVNNTITRKGTVSRKINEIMSYIPSS